MLRPFFLQYQGYAPFRCVAVPVISSVNAGLFVRIDSIAATLLRLPLR